MFETKKIFARIINGKLVIRVGGGAERGAGGWDCPIELLRCGAQPSVRVVRTPLRRHHKQALSASPDVA